MTDPSIQSLLEALRDEIAATGELPIDRRANRWLGEAEVIAADIADRPAPDSVIERRIADVRFLLEQIENAENDAADRHVAAALSLIEEIDRRL